MHLWPQWLSLHPTRLNEYPWIKKYNHALKWRGEPWPRVHTNCHDPVCSIGICVITDRVRSTRGCYIFSLFVCSHLGGYPIPGPGGGGYPIPGPGGGGTPSQVQVGGGYPIPGPGRGGTHLVYPPPGRGRLPGVPTPTWQGAPAPGTPSLPTRSSIACSCVHAGGLSCWKYIRVFPNFFHLIQQIQWQNNIIIVPAGEFIRQGTTLWLTCVGLCVKNLWQNLERVVMVWVVPYNLVAGDRGGGGCWPTLPSFVPELRNEKSSPLLVVGLLMYFPTSVPEFKNDKMPTSNMSGGQKIWGWERDC